MSIVHTDQLPERNLTHWERAALSGWGRYITEIERREICAGADMALQPKRAIEVGCEGGRWSKMLADAGWSMTCIDVDANTLASCRAKVPAAECILVRPEDTQIPAGTSAFSLLLCIEVAPVIHSNWFCSEAARVLQPGGIFVGVAWNKNSLRGSMARARHRSAGVRDSFYYKESYASFRSRLVGSGFALRREIGFCWGPFGRMSNSPLIPIATAFEKNSGLRNLPRLSPWVVFIAEKISSQSQQTNASL